VSELTTMPLCPKCGDLAYKYEHQILEWDFENGWGSYDEKPFTSYCCGGHRPCDWSPFNEEEKPVWVTIDTAAYDFVLEVWHGESRMPKPEWDHFCANRHLP